MPIDAKHEDLQSLRIDRTARRGRGEPPAWARRYILVGIALLVVLGVVATAYRLFARDAPEVEVVRASAENSDVGGIVLSASGYIVAHHKINLNTKVTGRVKWIGVEKGDKVKEGQILVRLEDDEFRAQYEQAKGAADNARAYLEELQNGSRPEEVQQSSIISMKLAPRWPTTRSLWIALANSHPRECSRNKTWTMRPQSLRPISSGLTRWRKVSSWPRSGRGRKRSLVPTARNSKLKVRRIMPSLCLTLR